jgi:exodeoxyribonuclease V alpha subunit
MSLTEPFEALGALGAASDAGVFSPFEVEVADMLVRRTGSTGPDCALGIALVAKAVRLEHVCLVLDDDGIDLLWRTEDGEPVELAAPEVAGLREALVHAGPLVEVVSEGADVDERGTAPLVLSGPRCYLRRYALLEQRVAIRLAGAHALEAPEGADSAVLALDDRVDIQQRLAIERAFTAQLSVVAGGPGTGKTTAIAALLEVARALPEPLRVALAAPTGKAAARLDEAVRAARLRNGAAPDDTGEHRARTIHSLLGLGMSGVARVRRRVDADLLVIDEASMVSLPLLATVLDAAGPQTRVVLVGDPDQLASIEVGAVLADVVVAAAAGAGVVVTTLETAHRFRDGEAVAALAHAVRQGDGAAVSNVLSDRAELELAAPGVGRAAVAERVADHACDVVAAARAGDAARALELTAQLGVLCGTRRGDGSTEWWRQAIEGRLVRRGVLRSRDPDYAGRPILVTRNDPLTGLTNGTTGIVVADGDDRLGAFELGTFPLDAVPWAETAWALTIHKSQGSEFADVVVSLPAPKNRVLTRELVYTAVTRAKRSVTVVAPPGTLEAALSRRVARASGLIARLQGPSG